MPDSFDPDQAPCFCFFCCLIFLVWSQTVRIIKRILAHKELNMYNHNIAHNELRVYNHNTAYHELRVYNHNIAHNKFRV